MSFFSSLVQVLRFVSDTLATLRSIGLRVALATAVVQAALVAVLVAMAELRKRRGGGYR